MRNNNKKNTLTTFAVISVCFIFLMGCFLPEQYINAGSEEGIFIYSLQSVGYDDLKDEDFDIAVLDIDDCGLTEGQINILKSDGSRLLSYLSIGEAEDYRIYWQDDWKVGDPGFIYEENPYWKGNYKVKYWYYNWQQIIYAQLDRIIERGFDGVYLDVVDAYSYFEYEGFGLARQEMIEFVIDISEYAKSKRPGFMVIPQNSEELIEDKGYFDSIDGLGKENLLYIDDKKIDSSIIARSLNYLEKVVDSGKEVFVISYVDRPDKIQEVLDTSSRFGFYYFIGTRELDRIECLSSYLR